ncbi:uncharacterized protein SOCE836_028020 [Sorangium cellulosum]|uniref:Uncharacterized protein n=1 Tax=Sorangium cellulosum TaxID=56 RepID=A0A4P2QLP5_SORCE|nr:uncharacterized protein SOCE836_028020 [Sorangium cellulosum]WCQ90079.1 hypothetical protein NQZ70_02780 [Sorangium sp. Soce836]
MKKFKYFDRDLVAGSNSSSAVGRDLPSASSRAPALVATSAPPRFQPDGLVSRAAPRRKPMTGDARSDAPFGVLVVKGDLTKRLASIDVKAAPLAQGAANPLPGDTPNLRVTAVERANPDRERDVIRPFPLLQLELLDRHMAKAQTARRQLSL